MSSQNFPTDSKSALVSFGTIRAVLAEVENCFDKGKVAFLSDDTCVESGNFIFTVGAGQISVQLEVEVEPL